MDAPDPAGSILPPVVKRIDLAVPPARACSVFTDGIDRWWPTGTHSISALRDGILPVRVIFEGRQGGKIFEIAPSGEEHVWGRVLAIEPDRRVVFSWHVGRPPAEASEIEVRFEPAPEGHATVTLTHRGWEALGEAAAVMRDRYDTGWDGVFGEVFASAAEAAGD